MKSVEQDGGECFRKWHQTRRANLLRLSGGLFPTLCIDEVCLTVCCRYVETLLQQPRISRYLGKHHAREARKLQRLLDDYERVCGKGNLGTKWYDSACAEAKQNRYRR